MPPNQRTPRTAPPKPPAEPQPQKGRAKASDISNTEWGLVIGLIAILDFVQFILDVLAIGLIANRLVDILIMLSLLFYFWMRGVEMDLFVLGTLCAVMVGEEVPGLDVAPFWTLDVWAIMRHDKAKKNLPI